MLNENGMADRTMNKKEQNEGAQVETVGYSLPLLADTGFDDFRMHFHRVRRLPGVKAAKPNPQASG